MTVGPESKARVAENRAQPGRLTVVPPCTDAEAASSATLREQIDRVGVLVGRVDVMAEDGALQRIVDDAAAAGRAFVLSFANAHAFNVAVNNPSFYANLLDSDLLLRDGSGLRLALPIFGKSAGANLNGTDLIPQLLRRYEGRRVAIFGTQEPWLTAAAEVVSGEYGCQVVATHDGFADAHAYLELAVQTAPDVIVLGMGMPRQEEVASYLAGRIDRPVLIINGGAVIDFLGGKVNRAPRVLRAVGLEWTYRLMREPRRLASRYLLGIPIFLSRVALARLLMRQPKWRVRAH